MKLKITDECIACGLCSDLYPDLFRMNNDGSAAVVVRDPQDSGEEDNAQDAASSCPVEAIKVTP